MNLTDEQNWAIVSAADDHPTRSLANGLGLPYSTVNNARWRFRRRGWTCAVDFVACAACGELITNDLPANARRTYHLACRAAAKVQVRKRIDTRRWRSLDLEQRRDVSEQGQKYARGPGGEHTPGSQPRRALD